MADADHRKCLDRRTSGGAFCRLPRSAEDEALSAVAAATAAGPWLATGHMQAARCAAAAAESRSGCCILPEACDDRTRVGRNWRNIVCLDGKSIGKGSLVMAFAMV